MTVKFDAPARADVSAIARFAPPWVKNAAWRIDGKSTIVEFETDSDSGFHDFKDGTHVVLDILAPKTDGAAYAPPGIAKPTVTKMKRRQQAGAAPPPSPAAPAQRRRKPSPQTAQQLADKNKPKPTARSRDAKAGSQARGQDRSRQPSRSRRAASRRRSRRRRPFPSPTAKRTRDGAVITFKGAGSRCQRRVRARPDRLGGAGERAASIPAI